MTLGQLASPGWWREPELKHDHSSVGASLRESGCVGWRLLSFMTWVQALLYMPPTTRQPRGLAALLGLLSNLDFLSVLRNKWLSRWRPLCVEGEEGVEVVLECAQGLASQHPLLSLFSFPSMLSWWPLMTPAGPVILLFHLGNSGENSGRLSRMLLTSLNLNLVWRAQVFQLKTAISYMYTLKTNHLLSPWDFPAIFTLAPRESPVFSLFFST